jgi:hypothetical protein
VIWRKGKWKKPTEFQTRAFLALREVHAQRDEDGTLSWSGWVKASAVAQRMETKSVSAVGRALSALAWSAPSCQGPVVTQVQQPEDMYACWTGYAPTRRSRCAEEVREWLGGLEG